MKQITVKPLDGRNANTMQIQRDLWDKIYTALGEGNDIGEMTVNCAIGAMLKDFSDFSEFASVEASADNNDANPLIGMIAGINVFVDPMMMWSDTRVLAEGLEITIDIDPSMIV